MSLKETLKKIPGVHRLGQFVKYFGLELLATLDLCRERRIPRQGVIRVGFLCQYLPAWDKLAPVYEKMQANDRFDPVLIAVPSGIENHRLTDPAAPNDTWEYLVSHGCPEAINAHLGGEQWLELAGLDLSYVFTVRPYDSFMPPPYTTKRLSRHSRVCLVLYGMPFAREDRDIALNRGFMSRVYLYFADNGYFRNFRLAQHPIKHKLGLQRTECPGMPVKETIAAGREEPRPAWSFASGEFHIMWTPRWTTNPKVGGTNFFRYRDALLEYAADRPDTALLLRPHPLMFDYFAKNGDMTAEEAAAYRERVAQMPNAAFDTEKSYRATFWGADVLVSDISGMIPEFLFTGKPLIFCRSNMELELLPPMERLLEGCYTVYDRQELAQCLDMLRRGEDPKAALRREVVAQVLGSEASPSGQILEILYQDRK